MAEAEKAVTEEKQDQETLEAGTYEIIRDRLNKQGKELRNRLGKLNDARMEVFGALKTELLKTSRIITDNNCIPRDMVSIGDYFIFGYNVHLGLRAETFIKDVFSVYEYKDQEFSSISPELIGNEQFEIDFQNLYRYYKDAQFTKFSIIDQYLHMVFQIGKSLNDIKTFKWLITEGSLEYVDNRSDHEFKFPTQHEFRWIRTHRDYHRRGEHPHISIEDRIFVETVGGDLTVKIEDNTECGEGIYAEEVKHFDQSLDDAEIFFASLGNNIILKIRPYQEKEYRYLVYNEKVQQVRRIDSIEDSCILLPDDHGLIFSNGYYLQNGEFKEFDHELRGMLFEKKIASPNGEDYLYLFYNQTLGVYVLLSYNLIEQSVDIPIICQGYATFDNGELVYFKSDETAQKHHTVQIWQTPYVGSEYTPEVQVESYLNKIGNKDLVRGMSECTEILNLSGKDDSYGGLYLDLVKKCDNTTDSWFWLDKKEAFNLKEILLEIRKTAASALEEFEKVSRIRKSTAQAIGDAQKKSEELLAKTKRVSFKQIEEYVNALAQLRTVRGELISLKDLRYADIPLIEGLEESIGERMEKVASACVDFLLKPEALLPYQNRVAEYRENVPKQAKVTEAKELEEKVDQLAADLDLLIETVSNLKIEDSTRTTQIIDFVSELYTEVNQTRALLRKKKKELLGSEAIAEFNSQLKLLSQAVLNYLDVSTTVDKCDEYLTKLMVQLEELEGKFAEFDTFIEQLSEKREEIYNAFESQKLQLQEQKNRRTTALFSSADRILKGIRNRLSNFKTVNEINGYFASDLMIDKMRDIVKELVALDDNVKADDLQTRLKTAHEDAVRQLKDRQELFLQGENVIKFGTHHFSVNIQEPDITIVRKDKDQFFHLTGTDLFRKITDPLFQETRDVWDQEVLSENGEVYRAEYLASIFLSSMEEDPEELETLPTLSTDELEKKVRTFMGARYGEGYVKGVHDADSSKIIATLVQLKQALQLLRYPAEVRSCAMLYWKTFVDEATRELLTARMAGMGLMKELFPENREGESYIQDLTKNTGDFIDTFEPFKKVPKELAGEYLFHELMAGEDFVISREAAEIHQSFFRYLKTKRFREKFASSIATLNNDRKGQYELILSWLSAFIGQNGENFEKRYLQETAALILTDSWKTKNVMDVSIDSSIPAMLGEHRRIEKGDYQLNYIDFQERLANFQQVTIPKYNQYTELKKSLAEQFKRKLRLEEFKPRVLSSFVRNRLIDKVFLPLIGDNLAKQIGVVGEQTRTDRMGLLLLISPPGYGKTTLMEYIASRLGIIFMKINGPAIGNAVTSLDPAEAPNASAREEVEKLNLSLEMGDNVMIYLDDIQHCNPEFLQKFISLCDGSRRIEGVYEGNSKTYDLRGKKVCVVMAGNPYTESGDKFQIPDMLSNRADTYNLGDIIGDQADSFKLSYLENCLVSNPVLNALANKSRADIYSLISIAETDSREGVELEGNYSGEEVNSYVNVLKKLIRVRDVILKVNLEYINSASQSDEYRTEPAFKLQGSYRNMAKLAEKVLPVMNDEELQTLILSHYEQEAQTLTTGAEANLLKFRELIGTMTLKECERWEEIKKMFQKNQKMGGKSGDSVGKIIGQMSSINDGLDGIRHALEQFPKGGGSKKR